MSAGFTLIARLLYPRDFSKLPFNDLYGVIKNEVAFLKAECWSRYLHIGVLMFA